MNVKKSKKSRALKFVLPLFVCICVMFSSALMCFAAADVDVVSVPYTNTAGQQTFYHLSGLPEGVYQATNTGEWTVRGIASGGYAAWWSSGLSSSDVVILTISSSGWSCLINGEAADSYPSYDFDCASGGTLSIVEYVPPTPTPEPTPTPGPMDVILTDVLDTADTSMNIGGTIISFIMSNPLALLGVVSWIAIMLIGLIKRFFKN